MDVNQYLGLFLEEAREHLQTLNRCVLDLEHDPGNLQILDEIFRSAHTIKGMSATMGYAAIAELTHEMENVLDMLCTHRRALHRIPEIEFDLPKTQAYVINVLQQTGCNITQPCPGAVCAFFDAGQKNSVAFRADMDAARKELAALRKSARAPDGAACAAEAELIGASPYN